MNTKRKIIIPVLVILCVLFLNVSGYAATVLKKIDVALNTLTVKVGTSILPNDNIVYKGNVYIRADKAATALGKVYSYDKTKNTVIIKDKPTPAPTPIPAPKYSYSNPAPLNTKQIVTVKEILQTYTVEMEIKEIIRGDNAWKMIQEANAFNDPPKDGYEYILAKIYFKISDINDNEVFDLNGAVNIKAISSDGKEYEYASVVNPEPSLDAKLYEGASVEGWQAYMVKKDDITPKLAFGRDYNGKGGIWFKAYKEVN